MKKMLWLALVGLGVYALYKGITSAPVNVQPKFLNPLPEGAMATGKTTTTYNGRPPDFPGDVVGTGVRHWAEVRMDDGSASWLETA